MMKDELSNICGGEHEEAALRRDELLARMPDTNELIDLAELYKVFGDSSRVRIMSALALAELCVCELEAALDMSQSAVSHQLRILRQAKLVRATREGKSMRYALDDEHVRLILAQGLDHLREGA
jgi:ArsR family transcriptional regulator, lead/cadmium/zinc/bismuth-responsive transcriptional repressor